MWMRLRRHWQQKKLRDPSYSGLFDEHPDELVSLDCETTSLKIAEAELLSIGAVKIRGNSILSSAHFYVLVRPERPLEASNVSIHGLRPRDLSEGIQAQDAVRQLLEFVGGRPLVGYYLSYDVAVLNRYIKPMLGIGLPQRQIEVSGRYFDYKMKQNPGAYIDLRLAKICADLGTPALPRHDALNDAISAGMIYLQLKRKGFG